jgi:hypothetical protein
MAPTRPTRALTTGLPRRATWGSARRSWAATCSARSVARGATSSGGAGGATTRPTTIRCSCSPTTRGHRRAAPGDRTDPARQRRAALRQPRGAPDRLRVRGARQLAGGGPRAARAHGSERVWVGARRVRWCSRQRARARRTRSCHTGNGVRLGVSMARSRRRGRGPSRAGPGGPPPAP